MQLAVLWAAAVSLAVLLLWIDSRDPYKFFWLMPYPSWRAWGPIIPELFRARPLAATAVIAIPTVAIVTTLGLWVARLPRGRRRGGGVGVREAAG